MKPAKSPKSSRREFLQTTGAAATASAVVGAASQAVHAAGSDELRVVLVGCGGRGTGAASDCLSVKDGRVKLVAMADVFENRLKGSYESLSKAHKDKVAVSDDHKFVGFDGYQKAMDLLKPGDIAIFATPPAFRWVHFGYAIEKNLNVFMEKPITVDGPSTRKMLKLGEEAAKKNLKVAVGLMCRHCRARGELFNRIKAGEIGDVLALRCYRMHGPLASFESDPKPSSPSELLWQISRFHSFLWASGGCFSDFYIHNIDECCWMKDAWPVEAQGSGGRHFRGTKVDQNFDSYSVEYTFGDGAKMFLFGRCIPGCKDEFASYAHGSKGLAVISGSGHHPANCRIYKGQKAVKENLVWEAAKPEPNPYHTEWEDLLDSIRNNKPHNEVKRGAEASLVTAMGRMAAHTGQAVTFDEMLNCDHEFAPSVDKLTMTSPAPIIADANGRYPVPQPGTSKREYEVKKA